MRNFIAAFFLAYLLTQASQAWDDGGHLLIAKIAFDRLAPVEQQKLQSALAPLQEGTRQYNAISAACYADDLKLDVPTLNWFSV